MTRQASEPYPPEPCDLDAERAVLGALFIDREAIIHVAPRLAVGDFYDAGNRTLYEAILNLYHRRIPPDAITVAGELERMGKGGVLAAAEKMAETVTFLMNCAGTAVHANYYANSIRERAGRRRVIAVGQAAVTAGYDESKPTEDIMAELADLLGDAANGLSQQGYVSMRDLMDRAYQRFGERVVRRIPFGIAAFDSRFGEMQPKQLTVIAGRPGNGKSALAAQIAYHNAVKHKRPVGMISLEMSGDEISDRMIALSTRVNMYHVSIGAATDAEEAKVMEAIARITDAPFFCDDSVSGDLFQIQARARQMFSQERIELLIVDYLQLMSGDSKESRVQEVGQISRGLKRLARELDIPVIALAQLNRAAESRSNGRPMLSDLRESGSIEQDADRVIFVHHPYLYDQNAEKNRAELIVAKHRNGPVGSVAVEWIPEAVRFQSVTTHETP